jgi:hypothetical protein
VILIIVIVVACVVSGCGKIVEGAGNRAVSCAGSCNPFSYPGKNPNETITAISTYCQCAINSELYKPESGELQGKKVGVPWQTQIRDCQAAVWKNCATGCCELPSGRRNH